LSMAPTAIPLAKRVIRGLRAADARAAASRALSARTAAEVEKWLNELAEPIGSKGN
jgi:phosphoenolpyruvate-protein kinase (PTS system EI component)